MKGKHLPPAASMTEPSDHWTSDFTYSSVFNALPESENKTAMKL
jgi:hypothetical protein